VTPDSTFPTVRSYHTMTMERQYDRALVYGGFDGVQTYYNDLWELDLQTLSWTQLNYPGAPIEGRAYHAAALDGSNKLVITSGHNLRASWNDVHTFNTLTHQWDSPTPGGVAPPADQGNPSVYAQGVVYQFGGRRTGVQGEYDTISGYRTVQQSWASFDSAPPERYDHVAFIDVMNAASPQLYVFGGTHADLRLSDTWALDVVDNVWIQLHPSTPPPARAGAACATDSAARRAYIFGGETGTGYLKDLWAFGLDSLQWTQVSAAGGPPKRQYSTMVMDPLMRRIWLFGGRSSSAPLNDLWYFVPDSAIWRQVAIPGGPSPRYLHSMTFDSTRRVLMVYGGSNDSTLLGDFWSFQVDSLAWQQETWTGDAPSPRRGHTAILDLFNQMVVYGGATTVSDQPSGDVWAYNHTLGLWHHVAYPGLSPMARWRHTVAWDPVNHGMHVYGGLIFSGPLTDSWALVLLGGLVGAPTPTAPTALQLGLPSPNPATGRVGIEFVAPAAHGTADVSVYDVGGRRVAELWQGTPDGARRRLMWDGRSSTGARCPAGIYFVRARVPGSPAVSRKIVRL
jgi:hypothetical protein